MERTHRHNEGVEFTGRDGLGDGLRDSGRRRLVPDSKQLCYNRISITNRATYPEHYPDRMASHQTDLGLSLLHAHQGCLAQLLGSIVAILDIPLIYMMLCGRTAYQYPTYQDMNYILCMLASRNLP